MSGPTYCSNSTETVLPDGSRRVAGTFTFLGRQDRYALDRFTEITGMPVKARQYATGQPVPFTRTVPAGEGDLS